MRVRVRAFAGFRPILGRELDVELSERARIEDLLKSLCASHRELRALLFDGPELKEDVNILVKGKNIESMQGMKTELAEGEEVALFSAAIGG